MENRSESWFKRMVDVIIRTEELDEIPQVVPNHQRASFFSRLMKSEDLPFEEVPAAARRASPPAGLFLAEQLPLDEPSETLGGRVSFASRLFSTEQLPFDPTPVATRGGERR